VTGWVKWSKAQARIINGVRNADLTVDEHLDWISLWLTQQRFADQPKPFRKRMAAQIERWLRDEGDTTPERLGYWYDVILNDGGHEDFLDVALDVWAAIDRAAVQSILLSCDRILREPANVLPLSA